MEVALHSLSILSPRETCPPLTYEAHGEAMHSGDILLHDTGHRVVLATIHASGEITGDKRAALDAVRNSHLDTNLRVALTGALHQAVLLDEALASQAAPRVMRCAELIGMHKRGSRLSLQRETPRAETYGIFRAAHEPMRRAATAANASRFAQLAAQAYPGTPFLVAQMVETIRLHVTPRVAA